MDKNYYFVINDGQVVRVFEELERAESFADMMNDKSNRESAS